MFALQIGTWSIGDIALLIVGVAAVVAIVGIALKRYGIQVPDWVVQIFWVLVVTAVAAFSIKLVMSLLNL